jgi:hypothetical protein
MVLQQGCVLSQTESICTSNLSMRNSPWDWVNRRSLLDGYGRTLGDNTEPISESPIRRTVFGGLSVKGGNPLDKWRESPQILAGSIKGLYSLILSSEERLKRSIEVR